MKSAPRAFRGSNGRDEALLINHLTGPLTCIGQGINRTIRAHMDDLAPIEVPIDGTLDLHAFRSAEIKDLIADYLEECRKRNIRHVRIVHGKGSGALRRSVHALLARLEMVADFRLGDETSGSWGATLVTLRAEDRPAADRSAEEDRVRRPDGGPGA